MRTKALALAFAGLLAAAVPAASFAGGPRVAVTIGIGVPPVVYYPPPVVYYPPPAVVFHVGGHFGGRHHPGHRGGSHHGYRHAGHRGWH